LEYLPGSSLRPLEFRHGVVDLCYPFLDLCGLSIKVGGDPLSVQG
jgi:hypothetical protein